MFHETAYHINYLELFVAFLALNSSVSHRESSTILLLLDNVTAIAFLNKMGAHILNHYRV